MKGPKFLKHGGFGGLGFLHKRYTGTYRPAVVCNPKKVDCPERKKKVHFIECVECEKFKIWHEKDGELRRCYYEFKDLESRGFYDGTWDDHPENFDPETFERIQERKRMNVEVNREMELERAELARKAEELAAKSKPSDIYEYYWEQEGEGGEPEEEEEPDRDEEDEDEEEDF